MRFDIDSAKFVEHDLDSEKLAVIGSDRAVSWSELEAESEELAVTLRSLDLPLGHPVLVRGHKEVGMVSAMIACMICGHPYVPLDVVVPSDRVRRILAITGSRLIIDHTEDAFPDVAFVLKRNGLLRSAATSSAEPAPDRPEDPIRYIIFTSGSTGEPKGVRITRESARAFLDWMVNDFGFGAADVYINQAPFSFDLSVYELFTSLHIGGTLLLNDGETAKDSHRFLDRIKQYNGSVWVSTPTFAYLYLTEPGFTGEAVPSIRHFLFCGESLPKATAQRLLDRFPNARVLNTYGPTEATVATTLIDVTRDVLMEYPDMPVGRVKRDAMIRCVTPDGRPAVKEAPGEIEIIGPHVSIGYLNNDALNTEKFFALDGQRGFRTGDYGWFEDGILFFNGRRDEQVKLNGFRIELGDIGAQMLAVPGVADAIAVPLKSGETVKRIVGFIRAAPGSDGSLLRETVASHLRRTLPSYMVPADLMMVEAFPVNTSHKTDRKALIELYTKRPKSGT
ncbi:MAG: AMP-binding protein [Flavobacteriales bacterium]|nr:AMP-binding protein [Flavobacteriales bacterium]